MSDRLASVKITKVSKDLGLVFGWAIVCQEGGWDALQKGQGTAYFDLQEEHVQEAGMIKAAADFMQESRGVDEMHDEVQKGHAVFVFPMTVEIAKAFGLTTDRTGLMVGVRPSPEVMAKIESGEYTAFSIGGKRLSSESA